MKKMYKAVLIGSAMAISTITLTIPPSMATAETMIKETGVESRNEAWAQHFPLQYESWKLTGESERIDDMLIKKPQLAVLWAGYGFSKDYNAPRGHLYAIQDNEIGRAHV